jgi:hypothetical protein
MSHETETKIELTAASFAHVLSHSTVLETIEQLNVYYDCDGAIAARSGSLRIRYVMHGSAVMTFKLPIESNEGRRVSHEIEAEYTGYAPRVLRRHQIPETIAVHLREVCTGAPRRLGAMRNRRHVVRLPGGDQAELDEVSLPGGMRFYEAEIESDDPAVHDSAVVAVRALAPDCRWSERSKFQRFRAALESLSKRNSPPGSAGHVQTRSAV